MKRRMFATLVLLVAFVLAPAVADADEDEDASDEEPAEDEGGGEVEAPTESGWVVELSGYHFHNFSYPMAGSEYVKRTLVRQLMTGSVKLPGSDTPFTMKEMGISHVLIAFDGGIPTMDTRYQGHPAPNQETIFR